MIRMALIGATLIASALTPTLAFAAGPSLPAQPAKPMGCPPEYGVGIDGGIGTVGMATSAASYWLTGPGTISYALSSSTTVGATISGNLSTDISIFVVDVTAQAGVAVSGSMSNSTTWTYYLQVPSGVSEFAQVYHEAKQATVGDWSVTGNCGYAWSDLQTFRAPLSSKANSTYLIQASTGAQVVSWP